MANWKTSGGHSLELLWRDRFMVLHCDTVLCWFMTGTKHTEDHSTERGSLSKVGYVFLAAQILGRKLYRIFLKYFKV